MDYIQAIWKPCFKINAMINFSLWLCLYSQNLFIYFLKILIFSSSLKWFIGMTPKEIAALYFFDKDINKYSKRNCKPPKGKKMDFNNRTKKLNNI